MAAFPSQTQKPAKKADTTNDRATATNSSAKTPLLSQRNRNQKIIFATATGLCLTLIGIGAVHAATASPSDSTSEAASASSSNTSESSASVEVSPEPNASVHKADVFNASPDTPKSSSGADVQTDITINGKDAKLGSDGYLHKVMKDGNSRSEVEIDVETNGQTSGSSVQIETYTRSSSSSGGSS